MFEYWTQQDHKKPLFPEIEWQKPEQKALAGKLLIIGGNKLGFAAAAQAYSEALAAGVGECKVALPDAIKKSLPPTLLDTVFVPTNNSGGMSKDALNDLKAAVAWADATLLIGDSGRNSETAIVFEQLLRDFDTPFIITRDAVDLLRASSELLLNRPKTVLIVSFAQLQKLAQAIYFPKTFLFHMQLSNLAETLHKFTISYPVTITTFHQEHLVVAHDGRITSTPFDQPMAIWRGSVATKASVYYVQNLAKPLEAITASIVA